MKNSNKKKDKNSGKQNKRKYRVDYTEKIPSNLIYGKNPVLEALRAGVSLKTVVTCDNDLFKRLKDEYSGIRFLGKNDFVKKYGDNTQNIIALMDDYKYNSLEEIIDNDNSNSLVLMLDHVEDPGNLGAIIRTADAAGVDGIIIPEKRAAGVNATVFKTSAGAVNHVKIACVTNLSATIDKMKKKDYWVYGAEAEFGKSIYEQDFSGKILLVMGSEGKGTSDLIKKKLDFKIFIPMAGKVNSLNVSVATAISLFEIKRKTK